ncbi:MAG: hypothetical protein RML40_06345 [Bacteroidota bacterium]|nr:hypothetical protein [Bacteroidota bacterium]
MGLILFYKVLILSFLAAFTQYAQDALNAEEVLRAVQKRYISGSSLRVKFVTKGEYSERGSLVLKRGNKYILELGNRTIICNGTIVWSYVPSEKKVIVSDFRQNFDGMSPERLFMNFPRTYRPNAIIDKGDILLKLSPSKARDQIGDMQHVEMRLSRNYVLKEIAVFDGSVLHEWEILTIIPDAEVPDSAFEWKPPQGVEIVDLRD